jgi:hypothetical protein
MMTSLESEIQTLASSIAALKADHPKSELIFEKVEKLKALKKQLAQSLVKQTQKFNRSALESTLLKRFFFAPSFEIYGGKINRLYKESLAYMIMVRQELHCKLIYFPYGDRILFCRRTCLKLKLRI